MPMPQHAPPPTQGQQPYRPPGPSDVTWETFIGGLNTNSTRPGIKDEECWWLDGFMPVGPNWLRTMWGLGAAIWTAPAGGSIVFFDFYNIGATPYMVGIHSDGGIWQINTNTGAATRIAADGTITNPTRNQMGITQWGSQYLIIVANQTNGYFIWDGTTFYTTGMNGPDGAPMPSGIQGTAVETYTNRVWVANGATVFFTAPGSPDDFRTSTGGGSFTSTDSFLRVGFTQLKQTNGFLYLIGDSSINYISGVQTSSASPPVTTFTNQNADPEIGTAWPATVDVFSRNILFANAFGAHVSYGGAVTKISDQLDGVYNTVPNFGNITPSAAKSIVFGKKIWVLLLPIINPVTGQQQNKLFCWSGKNIWWATGQDINLTFIQHQEINSVIQAYGTDGNKVYPLFSQPSDGFQKTAQSKLWAKPGGYQVEKSADRLWGLMQYYSSLSPTIDISIDNESGQSLQAFDLNATEMIWTTASGATMNWTTASGETMTWTAGGSGTSITVLPPKEIAQNGVLLGYTLTTSAGDMALISLAVSPQFDQYRG